MSHFFVWFKLPVGDHCYENGTIYLKETREKKINGQMSIKQLQCQAIRFKLNEYNEAILLAMQQNTLHLSEHLMARRRCDE